MSRNRKIESVHSTLRALGIFHGDQTRRPIKIQYRNRNGVVHEPDEHIRLFERTYDPVMWALGIAMPAAKQRHGGRVFTTAKQRLAAGKMLSYRIHHGRTLYEIRREQNKMGFAAKLSRLGEYRR